MKHVEAARLRVKAVVEAKWFTTTVLVVIISNALILGVEAQLDGGPVEEVLRQVDHVMLWIFVLELAARMFALGRRFFRDPWSWFDLVVVGIALIPASGSLGALRALRILRALRVIDAVPSMKRVVSGLVAAIPGLGSVGALLVLVMYVSAVIATELFKTAAPEYFGDLGTTAFSLFQVMTGEAWPDMAATVRETVPGAWIFFVLFILIVSFAVLNLFIAVIVSGMESIEADIQVLDKEQDEAEAEILTELRAIRAELAELRARESTNAA
ncbi:ion transporter [Myceligenerans crystallogenes]|uniref:Ion transport domain-containing protein n=1 Tax=Myceligenerans crystallogenes TaxID=316335 RepID=A0ABN2NER6_9MICO